MYLNGTYTVQITHNLRHPNSGTTKTKYCTHHHINQVNQHWNEAPVERSKETKRRKYCNYYTEIKDHFDMIFPGFERIFYIMCLQVVVAYLKKNYLFWVYLDYINQKEPIK